MTNDIYNKLQNVKKSSSEYVKTLRSLAYEYSQIGDVWTPDKLYIMVYLHTEEQEIINELERQILDDKGEEFTNE